MRASARARERVYVCACVCACERERDIFHCYWFHFFSGVLVCFVVFVTVARFVCLFLFFSVFCSFVFFSVVGFVCSVGFCDIF